MNNLEKKSLIKREDLNEEHYFQSILQEAHRLNLLSDSEVENIQMQSIKLLARQTERYTRGESSSVRVENAQSIFESILYSIGIYLKSLPDTDISLAAIKQNPLSELFQKGKKLIEKKVNISKHLLHLIQSDHVENNNIAYNQTIEEGLPEFFSTYDADFAAHDTTGSLDYPLNIDKMEFVGIEYIYNYLQKLYWENNFCKNFAEHDIDCVLRGYDEKYQDLLVNIFRIVFTNALGCIIANKNINKLEIGPVERQYLQEKLKDLPEDELYEVLKKTSAELCKELGIANEFLLEYISLTLIELSGRLKNALENDQLASIFVDHKEKIIKPIIHFLDGDKMEDELFRQLATEIRECRFVADKISIIQKEIHSISDLVDIMEADCLFENEFIDFFQSLGDNELAMLSNLLPINKVDSTLAESEKEWHVKLDEYFKGIDLVRRNNIIEKAEKIELC
ncbi:DUF6179 domain-containing protein [Acetivibrio cellulolyticus]|uniref:DUF6179 domain-containing protein n=1 Tax=Acetivibrio cellulolyticus TaxID=35830 RepID=UPI0001E30593|nr:DUF6179 domain-containing protein [Acetivibrio cellulolyticus]